MPTIYFAQNSLPKEDGFETLACETLGAAKAAAKAAYIQDKEPRQVRKIDLSKELGTRALMCALFNGEHEKFVGTAETVAIVGPRKRKGSSEEVEEAEETEEESEDNPYDI
jgi:hypothetical protein